MVLLTGATGFLGSFVLDELLNQGIDVIALARTKSQITKRYPKVQWIKGDLGNPKTLSKLPSQSDGIIHLASTLSVRPYDVMDVDIRGMWSLLENWDEGPFIFCSSTDVYGPLQIVPANEEHPLAPSHWYGLGKSVCEQQLRLAARIKKRDDFVVFRSPYILGSHPSFISSFLGRLITYAMAGGDFILPKKGNSRSNVFGHSWVNARDLSRWIVAALQGGPAGTYNVASGFCTWEELLEIVLALTNSSGRIVFKGNGDKTLRLCKEERRFSIERFILDYNIQDTIPLKETLIEIIKVINTVLPLGNQIFPHRSKYSRELNKD